jgi:hypothetical protein
MDDVIVECSMPWIKAILNNKELRSALSEAQFSSAVGSNPANRPQYAILSHFEDGFDKKYPELSKLMHDTYFCDPKFYDELKPAAYYHLLRQMLDHEVLNSVTIVTACVDVKYPVTASKIRMLERLFEPFKAAGVKVRYILTEAGTSKSEAIKKHEVVYTSFADDAVYNILDVIQNTDSHGKEFFLPRLRHNVDIPMELDLKREHKVGIFWYDTEFRINKNTYRLYDPENEHVLDDGQYLAWDH